jgi:hypothetical protein
MRKQQRIGRNGGSDGFRRILMWAGESGRFAQWHRRFTSLVALGNPLHPKRVDWLDAQADAPWSELGTHPGAQHPFPSGLTDRIQGSLSARSWGRISFEGAALLL